jgi:hypothetical protein
MSDLESEPINGLSAHSEPVENPNSVALRATNGLSAHSVLKPRKKRVVNLSEEERKRRSENMKRVKEKQKEDGLVRQEAKALEEAKKLALREERQKIKIESAKKMMQDLEQKKEKVVSKIKGKKKEENGLTAHLLPVGQQTKEEEPLALKKTGTYVDLRTDEKIIESVNADKKKKSAKKIKIINKMDSDDDDDESDGENIVIVNRMPKKKPVAEKKFPAAETKKPEIICKFV